MKFSLAFMVVSTFWSFWGWPAGLVSAAACGLGWWWVEYR